MCTLYANTKRRDLIRSLFRVSDNRASAFEPKDAILPSDVASVVRVAEGGQRELVSMSWGFVRQ
jgi:putative SOS response-associated peptidase YedK